VCLPLNLDCLFTSSRFRSCSQHSYRDSAHNIAWNHQVHLARYTQSVVYRSEADICHSPSIYKHGRSLHSCDSIRLYYAICQVPDWAPIQNNCTDQHLPPPRAC
jgi:hypothetical protein